MRAHSLSVMVARGQQDDEDVSASAHATRDAAPARIKGSMFRFESVKQRELFYHSAHFIKHSAKHLVFSFNSCLMCTHLFRRKLESRR